MKGRSLQTSCILLIRNIRTYDFEDDDSGHYSLEGSPPLLSGTRACVGGGGTLDLHARLAVNQADVEIFSKRNLSVVHCDEIKGGSALINQVVKLDG